MLNSSDSFQHKILSFLARYPNEAFKSKELARRLGIRNDADYLMFKQALRILQDKQQITKAKGKRYRHHFVSQNVIGKLELTRQGSGFVFLDDSGEEVFISPRDLGLASHGDVVEVSLFAQSSQRREKDAKREGEVVRVVKRSRETVVGTLERGGSAYAVIPDDPKFGRDIFVPKESLRSANVGDKVVVEIQSWGKGHFNPEGAVVEVLGKAGEVSAEILSVAREFDLPMSFPSEVIRESEHIGVEIPETEIRKRVDFRKEICFTIDPEDAKDFDDAVSLQPLPSGNFRLGVHIADVSYYVTEGSSLDAEALKRGTSVYFPNGVIPMLPERLSNLLCSLRPDEDRLAYSVFMEVTPKGVVKDYEIRQTVIRSKRRFTYEQVQEVLDGRGSSGETVFDEFLLKMYGLSSTLTKKRMNEGSIDFESAEAKFRFDEQGKPTQIIKKARMESHRLVEEFMLLANRMVAKHIGLAKKEEHQKPFLYRVHDSPDPERIRELSAFVAKFGYKLNVDGGVLSKDLQKLLEQVRGTEVENVINEVALRAMAKAIYSERNIGHYGLAFDYYSHFTSPIRRYPDLVVHRLLKRYEGGISIQEREGYRQRLPYVAKQSSEMERRAMEAERAAVKVMQVEYMKRHVGDEFHAVISGVTRYGLFIEINDLLVEGMIHVRDMEDDYYVYDEKHYALVGRHTKTKYRLGDSVYVKVIRVNPEERKIDFVLQTFNKEKQGRKTV
ncbi:MAG: ribonuclease R [Ignavibacteriales bacterium]|nr:ribonuclease R [Ignavibacteriales bacterium]